MLSRYTLQNFLGQGAFGQVYLAVDNETDQVVAIKKISIDNDSSIKKEVNVLQQLTDFGCVPNILCYREFFYDERGKYGYLVTDYINGKDLSKSLQDLKVKYKTEIYFDIVIQMLRSLLKALVFIHERGIVHRDIKPENIIVSESVSIQGDGQEINVCNTFEPILIDFGLACLEQRQECLGIAGTAFFMAPEVAIDGIAYPQSDLWSLGLSLYNILVGDPWPENYSNEDIIRELEEGNVEFNIDTGNVVLDDFLSSVLQYDRMQRLTALEWYNKISRQPMNIKYVERI